MKMCDKVHEVNGVHIHLEIIVNDDVVLIVNAGKKYRYVWTLSWNVP